MTEPLLPRPTGTDPTTLDDLFLCIAATIEDSLISSGAIPGQDYKYLDLYKLAQPFVLHSYGNPKANMTFTDSWPR